ncbi:uncharacterized protein LOC124752643 [Schistocerca piceifrons]|uniref:uncharacterized protein LOC124752643 n=1 Tax=Schistocerca piceifrons TaxID=274613 RepID=UPI001F5FBD38|nr:uncharacterized protein LOC124752643 [Schistocerca piceifrons]
MTISTQKQEFQREINLVYDQILTELTKRYEAMASISSEFYFLTGEALKKEPIDVLLTHAADFGIKYSHDVDVVDLSQELEIFRMQAKELINDVEKATPLDILKKIQELSLEDIYPNIQIALRIYLTLPVTVASCERSFSKIKLIYNNFRSSMGQERLSNLSILSTEHEEVAKLNLEELIDNLRKSKPGK